MIEIRISETGFVSGQAWETIGYEGDSESRIVHTIYHIPDYLIDKEYVASYQIKSKYLGVTSTIDLDEDNIIRIPREFMSKSQKLWFQFNIKVDNEIVFHSNPFHLNIESSLGKDAQVELQPGANVCISVSTIEDRNNIPRSQLADGKLVRVSDVDGEVKYYSWDLDTNTWILEVFGMGEINIEDVKGLVDALSWHGFMEDE